MAVVRFDALKTKAFGAITASYTTFGTPISKNLRVLKITNNTNGDMLVSFDGTTDNVFIPANGFVLYDFATNALNVQDSDWFVIRTCCSYS